MFLFVKCYLHAFRYCILGILYTFIFRYVCKAPESIDRALYKYCIIIIIIITKKSNQNDTKTQEY